MRTSETCNSSKLGYLKVCAVINACVIHCIEETRYIRESVGFKEPNFHRDTSTSIN